MNKKIKFTIQIILLTFPWYFRRIFLNLLLNFNIHKSARIGASIILSEKLTMKKFTKINHFTFCQSIDELILEDYSKIGTFNYITGYPTSLNKHFKHIRKRKCVLRIETHSSITSRHFLDCTAGINIGKFTTIAGIRSYILTHSLDLFKCRQDAKPINIGDYCFIGTNCEILPGSNIPNFSILGAKSLFNKKYDKPFYLYGGVPAKIIKKLDKKNVAYFNRKIGAVI